MKVIFLFPPGWSLLVGSPHLAIPLLKANLQREGVEVKARDLNWEISQYYQINLPLSEIKKACLSGDLDFLNRVYYRAENKLMVEAKRYCGEWNLQLGFKNLHYSASSSRDALKVSDEKLPFTDYYRHIVVPWISREEPKIVAISIASQSQIIPALHLCKLLKENDFNGTIIVGGNVISRLRKEIVIPSFFDSVDVIVFFQGETTLLQLCQNIIKSKNFDYIPNIAWKGKNGIRVNEAFISQDCNSIPPPDFDGFPVGKYFGINYLPLVQSRGCYHNKCNFCSIPFGWGKGKYGRTRKVDLVYQDMLFSATRYGIKKFKFVDESLIPSAIRALSKMIIDEGMNFEWEGYARLDECWTENNHVSLLAKAGFKKVYFGLEICPTKSRIALKKNDHAHNILAMLQVCYDAGIKTHLFCMFGYPGTGKAEAKATVDFILKHKDIIDTVDINAFTYAKHTYITGVEKIMDDDIDWALEYSYIPKDKHILRPEEVKQLTQELEEIIWEECPRLLHPIYRLLSPWSYTQVIREEKYALSAIP